MAFQSPLVVNEINAAHRIHAAPSTSVAPIPHPTLDPSTPITVSNHTAVMDAVAMTTPPETPSIVAATTLPAASGQYSMPSTKQKAFTKQSLSDSQLTCTNGNFQCDKNEKPVLASTEGHKKPRMIAEVKPMRMSYSDVLSKNVQISEAADASADMGANRGSSGVNSLANGTGTAASTQKSSKFEKGRSATGERKSTTTTTPPSGAATTTTATILSSADEAKEPPNNQVKASRTTTSTNSTAGSNVNGRSGVDASMPVGVDAKVLDVDGKAARKKHTATTTAKNVSQRPSAKAGTTAPTTATSTETLSSSSASASSTSSTKRRSTTDTSVPPATKEDGADKSQAPSMSSSSNSNGFFYNITKTEAGASAERPFSGGSYAKNNQQRKSASSKSSAFTLNRTGSNRLDKSGSVSTPYQQKRNNKSRQPSTYTTILWKVMNAWLDYTMLFLRWLLALVCDVIVLSVGIIIDYCSASYQYVRQSLWTIRTELTNNSDRPLIYFTQLWQRFDNKFHKNSKLAIWRRIFAKKKPVEPVPDYYKNGRLPQTGDEAMYSLLNCKGKDAYR